MRRGLHSLAVLLSVSFPAELQAQEQNGLMASVLGIVSGGKVSLPSALKSLKGAASAADGVAALTDYASARRANPPSEQQMRDTVARAGKALCDGAGAAGCFMAPPVERVALGGGIRVGSSDRLVEACVSGDLVACNQAGEQYDQTTARLPGLMRSPLRDPSVDAIGQSGGVGRVLSYLARLMDAMRWPEILNRRPAPEIGSADSEPKNAAGARYQPAPRALGTSRDSPCLNYNQPGASVPCSGHQNPGPPPVYVPPIGGACPSWVRMSGRC